MAAGSGRVSDPPPEPGRVSERPPETPEHRLDPDRAAAVGEERPPSHPPPMIDTRPYRRAIGLFGLLLVLLASGYLFATRGVQTE